MRLVFLCYDCAVFLSGHCAVFLITFVFFFLQQLTFGTGFYAGAYAAQNYEV